VILARATLRYSTPTVAPEQMAQTTFGVRLHPPSRATSWHKMVIHKKWPSIQAGGLGEIWYDDVPANTDGWHDAHSHAHLEGGLLGPRASGYIYRSDAIGGTAVIYIDGLRSGWTHESVDN
jgi:hypothetical protein